MDKKAYTLVMNTAKQFVFQLGSLITLYVSITSFLVLVFALINLIIPDPAESLWQLERHLNSIRFSIATLIVFFPAYLVATRYVHTQRQKEQSEYIGVIRWLVYLSLLIGGLILLGSTVSVVYTFLSGELTLRFVLKALVLVMVVGAASWYYGQDVRGYWSEHQSVSKWYATGVASIVLIAIVAGFYYIDGPSQARDIRLEQRQIEDLQEIQWRIVSHWQTTGTLPETLSELYSTNSPQPPEDREAYEYLVTDTGFSLCATFTTTSVSDRFSQRYPYRPGLETEEFYDLYDWNYESGRYCFERTLVSTSER